MADDWDLYAVVRSCTPAAANTTATASNDFKKENSSSWREESRLACLTSLTIEEEDDLLSFSSFLQLRKNGSIQDSYKPFLPYADPTTISANQGIDPTTASSVLGGSNGQHHQHQRSQQLQEHPTTSTIGISSPLTPISATNFAFGQSGNQQQPDSEQQINPLHRQRRNMHSQAPRSTKRKNHQKRTVCQVREDNFSSDPWAWRKYGQKPIKGSPYPRNYYRCSSSKGCSARKQVERSNLEPNIFIVTYRGNHTHPRPTHRNSLAGSTRNKLSTIPKAASKDSALETLPATTASCSSLCSATRLSPISPRTPLSALEEATDPVHHTGGNGGVSLETAPEGESGEQDLLIPNVHVDEDLFKGLEELVGGSGSSGTANTNSGLRRSPAFSENFSSWRTGNSAAAAGSTAGGG